MDKRRIECLGFRRWEFQTVSTSQLHSPSHVPTHNQPSGKNNQTKKQTQRTVCAPLLQCSGENWGSHPTPDLKYTPRKQQNEEMEGFRTSLHQTLSQDRCHLQAQLDTRTSRRDNWCSVREYKRWFIVQTGRLHNYSIVLLTFSLLCVRGVFNNRKHLTTDLVGQRQGTISFPAWVTRPLPKGPYMS